MNTSKIGNLHVDLSSVLSNQEISNIASEMSGMNDDDFMSTWKMVGKGNVDNAVILHSSISDRIVRILQNRLLPKP